MREKNLMKLAEVIRNERLASDMSLRQLSILSGVHYSTISKIENCELKKIDPIILCRLSLVLKFDLPKALVLAGYFELVYRLCFEKK